jgi:hypothetical protein
LLRIYYAQKHSLHGLFKLLDMWVEIFLEYAWKGEDCETTKGAVDPCSSNTSSKVRVLQVVQF